MGTTVKHVMKMAARTRAVVYARYLTAGSTWSECRGISTESC